MFEPEKTKCMIHTGRDDIHNCWNRKIINQNIKEEVLKKAKEENKPGLYEAILDYDKKANKVLVKWIWDTIYNSWEDLNTFSKDIQKIIKQNPNEIYHFEYPSLEDIPLKINKTPIKIVNKIKHLGIWLSSFAPNLVDEKLMQKDIIKNICIRGNILKAYHLISQNPHWNLFKTELRNLIVAFYFDLSKSINVQSNIS